MTDPTAVLHRSLPESVYLLLRRRILNNEFQAGQRLIEASIAEELGVSRSTVREALRQLSVEGLVDISPRRHSVVTRMAYEDIRDACYARFVLEAGAARSISERTGLIVAMKKVVAGMAEAAESGDVARMIDLDTEFHGCIIDASGRHRLGSLWRMLDAQMGALMRSSIDRQHIALDEAVRRHQLIVDVFGAGTMDEIVAAMEEHYLGTVDGMAEAGVLSQ
ncbi:GntR family transcriptional regulator [Asanoa ishikariensis]|uniref:Transcriptional regulator, GntR family n=1 Tax=Asanoa ishikariensis TaxID=137265 RepID=A0A1H3UP82_9ACTN|nr:GntR family transcriptional regulator [Asanoa ishikariensis]GIF69111.1 GntR family transcriptional regulator [Asanoa ishikariensis]SDZ64167.1 transcriptional regulator, GntR family [Asanoa ishikariensis]